MRHPDSLGAALERELELLERERRLSQRHDRDAHQARVVPAEIRHVPIVRACRAVAQLRRDLRARRKRHRNAMRREHQLFLETEHVDGLRAFAAVKRAQRLDLLRSLDQIVAPRDHLGDMRLRMPPAARHDLRNFLIGNQRRAVAHHRDVGA
jgi:hypothetical protein